MNRNQIFDALFALASTGEGRAGKMNLPSFGPIVWTSRRLRMWADVPGKPAMCQTSFFETISKDHRLPYKNLLEAEWWFYFDTATGEDAIPDNVTNDIVDAAQLAILVGADPEGRQTLGGLVYDCWIEGQVLKVPGDIDGQGLVTIPIKILVP